MMSRRSNKDDALRALFAKSGNVCAFPGCNEEMVTKGNMFAGQICHIEAASPGGPRYNISSNDEERRSFGNLMLMCYKHHREIDNDVANYDVESLRVIKQDHEARHGQHPFKINESFLFRIESQMEEYWDAISEANKNAHVIPELAVRISTETSASQQFSEIYGAMKRLSGFLNDLAERDRCLNDEIRNYLSSLGYDLTAYDAPPYYKNPFFNRNWEIHFLALTNTYTDIAVALKHVEVRFLEEYVKTHPADSSAIGKLDAVKAEFEKIAVSAGYVD